MLTVPNVTFKTQVRNDAIEGSKPKASTRSSVCP